MRPTPLTACCAALCCAQGPEGAPAAGEGAAASAGEELTPEDREQPEGEEEGPEGEGFEGGEEEEHEGMALDDAGAERLEYGGDYEEAYPGGGWVGARMGRSRVVSVSWAGGAAGGEVHAWCMLHRPAGPQRG